MSWQLVAYICMNLLSVGFFVLLFIALVQYVKAKIQRRFGPEAKALALAGMRFAKGEIDADTYRRMRVDLRN